MGGKGPATRMVANTSLSLSLSPQGQPQPPLSFCFVLISLFSSSLSSCFIFSTFHRQVTASVMVVPAFPNLSAADINLGVCPGDFIGSFSHDALFIASMWHHDFLPFLLLSFIPSSPISLPPSFSPIFIRDLFMCLGTGTIKITHKLSHLPPLKIYFRGQVQGFPGSPVVKILCFHCRRQEFSPWLGN